MTTKITKAPRKLVAKTKEVAVKTEKIVSLASVRDNNKLVILQPRITEKAAMQSETKNVYVFNVATDANKNVIAKAIKNTYKVTPAMVRTTTIKAKNVFVRGKWGVKAGGKKAYVYLKKGDKIEIQ